MASPVTPVGRPRRIWIDPTDSASFATDIEEDLSAVHGIDTIAEAARMQDEERRIREDNEHFARTGENRPPVSENSPLVDDNFSRLQDVANDGDSYDEVFTFPDQHAYVEDAPSRLINRPFSETARARVMRDLNIGITREQEEFNRRKKIKEDAEFKKKAEANKKKFKTVISGLVLNED